MTPSEFVSKVSLYGALIETWNQVGPDLVAHAELAGYNQPEYDPEADTEIRSVVLVFKSVALLDDETRSFSVPANGDARVFDQEATGADRESIDTLELTCEIERYPSDDAPGWTGYATLRFRFTGVEIVDAPVS